MEADGAARSPAASWTPRSYLRRLSALARAHKFVNHARTGSQQSAVMDVQNTEWRGAGGGGVLAGTRRPSAAGDGVPPSLQIPPHTHILLARSPAPYSPFRRRAILQLHFQVPWCDRLP